MFNSSGRVGIKEHETRASIASVIDGEREDLDEPLSEPYTAGKGAKSNGMPERGDGMAVARDAPGELGGERPKSLNADLCRLSAAIDAAWGEWGGWLLYELAMAARPTGKEVDDSLWWPTSAAVIYDWSSMLLWRGPVTVSIE